VIFIDAVNVKIRDGNVANRPIYIALAVTVEGTRDILGLWAGEHGDGEGAKFWARVLSEIKNRGTHDVCMVVCDGLKGLPAAIETVWPQAITQTCIVHLLRNSFRYASKKHWAALAKDLKPIYTAPSESAALDAFVALTEAWGDRYPAIIKLWESAWPEFVPFLQFDTHIRTVICTTNAIESINARIRRAVHARGHFLLVTWNQIGAEKILVPDGHGTGRQAWRQRGWRTSGRCSAGTSERRAGCGCGSTWVEHRGRSTRMRAGWPSSCRSVRTMASTRSPQTGPMSRCSFVS
jgi:putative transposase